MKISTLRQIIKEEISKIKSLDNLNNINDINNFLKDGDYEELDGYSDEEVEIIKKHIKSDILDKNKKLTPSSLNSLIVDLEDKYDWY